MDSLKRILFAILAPVVIGGCYAHATVRDDGYYTTVAPPAAYVEVAGAAPYAGAVWVDGYWGWNSGRYAWHHGVWEVPRPGYVWERHVWVREGNGWRFHGGHWRRAM